MEVFEQTFKPTNFFLNGYAYGTPGAGKTHTTLGSAAEPGALYPTA